MFAYIHSISFCPISFSSSMLFFLLRSRMAVSYIQAVVFCSFPFLSLLEVVNAWVTGEVFKAIITWMLWRGFFLWLQCCDIIFYGMLMLDILNSGALALTYFSFFHECWTGSIDCALLYAACSSLLMSPTKQQKNTILSCKLLTY